MIGRALLAAAAACLPALAQIQLSLDRTPDAALSPSYVTSLGTFGSTGGTVTFRVTNTSSAGAQVTLALKLAPQYTGSFAIANVTATSFVLVSQAYQRFDIKLTPDAANPAGTYLADLLINTTVYKLQAVVSTDPSQSTQPKFRIVVTPDTLASGAQATLALKFDAVAVADAAGNVRLDFNGGTDPTVAFVAGGRQLAFTITAGEDTAKFQGEASAAFQTGSTAGTIKLTATLAPDTDAEEVETASFVIAPALVFIDSIRRTNATGQMTIGVSGYDNTHSTTLVRFTFFDSAGKTLGSGPMSADVTTPFQQYFKNSALGGMFALRAQFPVSGDVSKIDSVKVELTSSAGTTSASAKMTE